MQFVDVLIHMRLCFCWNSGHLPNYVYCAMHDNLTQ